MELAYSIPNWLTALDITVDILACQRPQNKLGSEKDTHRVSLTVQTTRDELNVEDELLGQGEH